MERLILRNYDVHNIFNIQVEADLLPLLHFMGTPSERIYNEGNKPSIVIKTVHSINLNKKLPHCYGYFHGGFDENIVYLDQMPFRQVKMQMILKNLPTKYTECMINTTYYKWGKTLLSTDINPPWVNVRDLIFIKLLQNDHAFLHSSAVAKGGHTVLVCALPDVGKSQTAFLTATKYGFTYISDDITIINSHSAFANIPVLGITPHTRETYNLKLRRKDLVKMWLNASFSKLLHRCKLHLVMDASLQYFDVRDALKQTGVKITAKAPVKLICLLEKGKEKVKEIGTEETSMKLLTLNRSEFSYYFNKLFLAYDYFNKAFRLDQLMDRETDMLKSLAERCDCILLRSMNGRNYSKLLNEIF